MKIKLRKYQNEIFHNVRDAFKNNRAVLMELGTGGGKSVILAKIVESFLALNKKWNKERHVYAVVDEKFLLYQLSDHLKNIPHDIVGDSKRERSSTFVHVCTIQTLAKLGANNTPALIIVDEAHITGAERYMNLFALHPDSKILGVTASPESTTGKGLSLESGNGIFDIMIKSPVTMADMTFGIEETDEAGIVTTNKYLSLIRYFGVPIKGIEDLHMQTGDYKTSEVEKLLKDRGTFGDAISEMRKFPDIVSHILFFCKSVKSCYEMETVLHSNGYSAEVLEGAHINKERKGIMGRFNSGKTQVIITCRLFQKGVDAPDLRMGIDMQPTPSRGLQRQKIGRFTRMSEGKEFAVFLDMVGNHRVFPDSNIYADFEWRFNETGYNKKPNGTGEENVCPLCYALIPVGKTNCPECGAEKKKPVLKPKPEKHLDGDLVELNPIAMKDRTEEDKTEITVKINKALIDGNIEELYKIGLTVTSKNKVPLWIYYKLNDKQNIVNVPLLYRIQRSLNFKNGWVHFIKNQIRIGQGV